MTEVDAGHYYLLDMLDSHGGHMESLRFVKRIGEKFPGNEAPGYAGTTTQEVLRVLIARTKYVNGQMHSDLNLDVIRHLRDTLFLLEERAAATHGRQLYRPCVNVEDVPTCPACGHILCQEHPGT